MIIAVTGHQIIPEAALPFVRDGVRAYLTSRLETSPSDATLISCLAVGADQLAASTALELGYRLCALIPSHNYESTFGADKESEYRNLLARADETIILDFDQPCEKAYMAAGTRLVDDCDELLALWDGYPAVGLGGTGDVVAYARKSGKPMHVVWPEGIRH